MAGPSLSHILDPPQPTARSGHYAASQPYVRHDSDSNRTHAATPTSTSLSSSVSPRIQQKTPTSVSPSAPATASPAVAPTSAPPAAVSGVAAAAASAGTHGQQAASSPAPSQSNHSGNNLYACRDCGRSYSRPEHLVRHVQTHTLGRRFTCDICQKSFARKDLLRRHVANHDNDSPKKRRRTTTSPGAGRVSHACRSCAVARVKCDDQKPCKRCVSRKLTCVSSEAPSTAAMHLMHLSANSHSVSANNGINPTGNDGDKPATTHSSTASTGSASPAPYSQARPMPVLPAPSQGTAIVDRTIAGSPALPPMNPDDSQLPTPESIGDQGYGTDYAPPSLAESLPSLAASNRLPFPEFLRNVLFENQMDPGRMTDYQGLGILDFCDNVSLEMTDADFGLLDYWNTEGLNSAVDGHSRSDSSSDSSHLRQSFAKLWANSPWSWDGRSRESSYRNSASPPMGRELVERTVPERLEQSARDRVLALVLGNCRQNSSLNRVASSFPSTEVMDTLIHNFLSCLARQSSEWIHFPSFRLNEQWPEWIAMAAATGAVLTPIPTLHRFGFALQDAVRLSLLGRFQDTSSPIQDMGLVQALILVQDIGLWSGNRRKMEIAECHLGIPVTMMRYRGKFQKSSYPVRAVEPSDEGSLLEDKWRKWVERERWKRLVFHCYLRDAQCSLTTLTNPTMSYAELTLPMPEPRELWHAMSAVEWKSEYLAKHNGANIRPPSVGDLLHEVQVLPANHQRVDMQLSIAIYLHGVWALILEYQQLSAVHRARSYSGSVAGNQGLLLNSRHQELVKDLSNFHLMSADWPDMTPQEHLMLSLLLMHLHVSMDDLQLFAGKEGEDQARRTLPVLQQWANSPEARSALWYAGQVMRHAKSMAPGQLKDFCAVGVHQACMTLWTYGIVTKADRRHQQPLPGQFGWELVYLDGTDTMSIQRFVGFGQGRPAIQGPVVRDATSEAPLAEPKACVDIAQDILRGNFRNRNGTEGVPPIVENLCRLIKQLGDAAWTVGLG